MRPRERNKANSSRSSFPRDRRRGVSSNSNNYGRRKKDERTNQKRSTQSKRREKDYESFSKDSFKEVNQRSQAYRPKREPRDFDKRSNSQRFSRQLDSSYISRRVDVTPKNRGSVKTDNLTQNELPRKDFVGNDVHDWNQNKDHLAKDDLLKDIFWGRHATQAILETGRPLHRIWCTSELRTSQRFLQLLRDAKSVGVLVEEVSWSRLGHLTNGGVHQGIALQTAASETVDLATLIDGCSCIDENPVLLALDGLTDPHNLGAIVRSAEALGAHGVVLPQRRSAGLTGSVAKVAAGALEHLPVARVVNLNRSLEALKKVGYTIVGLAEEGSETLNQLDIQGPLVVVIGSENKGLSLLTRRYCDQLIRIPLRGVTTSLNASVATSIFLYEVARRSWMSGMSGNAPPPKLIRAKLSQNN